AHIHLNGLHVGVLPDHFEPTLPAVAAHLDTAVGLGPVMLSVVVDPDKTGLEPAGHSVGPADVIGPHPGHEPVAGIVGQGEGLFFSLELEQHRYRTENFVLAYRR